MYLQSAPLGEFAARLALLDAFRRQLAAMSAGGGAEAQAQRWRQLSAVLYNVVRYYRQFEPAVQRHVAAGMGELEKQLQVSRVPAGGRPLSAACCLHAGSCNSVATPGPISHSRCYLLSTAACPCLYACRTLWRWPTQMVANSNFQFSQN